MTKDLLAPLKSLSPQRTTAEQYPRTTEQIQANIKESGFHLVPGDFAYPGRGARVRDPARKRELDEVDARLRDAERERQNFIAEHGQALADGAREREFAKVDEALASRDPDGLRAAIDGPVPAPAPNG